MNINVKDIIADSHLAFLNQENETALRLARQAISLAPDNPDAYRCAGNACMSLDRYDEAMSITGQLSNMILTTATGIMTLDLR